MAIAGSRELASELAAAKKGKAKNLYLVFGTEGYLVRTAADALVRSICEASGAEVVGIDASGKTPEAVLEPATSLSLFASASVTVVRDFTHLLVGDAADRLLAGIDRGITEGSTLIFVAPARPGQKIDKRVKGYKGLVKRGTALELNTQKPEDLEVWLQQKAGEAKKTLAPDAAQLLLQRAGTDMEVLRSELDKALLYCLDQQEIRAADLEKLVGKSREDAVWDIGEAIGSGNAVRALALVTDLLTNGVYPLVILTLLVRQTRHLLQARLLWEGAGSPGFRDMRGFQARVLSTYESGAFGKGADDVTTIHPFASFKRFEAAQRQSVTELRQLLARLRRADREAKTGATGGPNDVIQELVLDLCLRTRSAA